MHDYIITLYHVLEKCTYFGKSIKPRSGTGSSWGQVISHVAGQTTPRVYMILSFLMSHFFPWNFLKHLHYHVVKISHCFYLDLDKVNIAQEHLKMLYHFIYI